MLLVNEDNVTHTHASNPLGAYVNAKERGAAAMKQHKEFFESDQHLDRLDAVAGIIKEFFGRFPDYNTPRGLNRKRPFEAVKVADVGRILSKTPTAVKNERLYKPLLDLGNIEVQSKNGHLIIRVYPVDTL